MGSQCCSPVMVPQDEGMAEHRKDQARCRARRSQDIQGWSPKSTEGFRNIELCQWYRATIDISGIKEKMLDIEKQFTITAFTKWIMGEPLSYSDIERIVNVFENINLVLEQVDPAKAAALQVRLRSVIQNRFMPKGQ